MSELCYYNKIQLVKLVKPVGAAKDMHTSCIEEAETELSPENIFYFLFASQELIFGLQHCSKLLKQNMHLSSMKNKTFFVTPAQKPSMKN